MPDRRARIENGEPAASAPWVHPSADTQTDGQRMDQSEVEFLAAAVEAAQAAGQVLQDWAERFTVSEKGPADLVTEADVASQAVIHDILRARFPDHGFVGEEGLRSSGSRTDFRWIIDPLDGTSNYVHRFPYYAVSIGLECRGELVAGVDRKSVV